jgi:uncharacterized membrane protein YfcA
MNAAEVGSFLGALVGFWVLNKILKFLTPQRFRESIGLWYLPVTLVASVSIYSLSYPLSQALIMYFPAFVFWSAAEVFLLKKKNQEKSSEPEGQQEEVA